MKERLPSGATVTGTVPDALRGLDDNIRESYRYRSVFQRTELEVSGSPLYYEGYPFLITRAIQMQMWKMQGIGGEAGLGFDSLTAQFCTDGYRGAPDFPTSGGATWAMLAQEYNVPNLTSCAPLLNDCFGGTSVIRSIPLPRDV